MTEEEKTKSEAEEIEQNNKEEEQEKSVEELLEEKEQEIQQYKDKLQRIHADFENFKKRSIKEKQEFVKFANEGLILKVLEAYEDLERALEVKEDKNLREGVELIYKKLTKILEDEGVEPIETKNQKFDPYKHPEAAEKRRNTVLTLMVRHGYITEEEKNMATDVSIESMLAGGSGLGEYEGYLDTVIQEVKDKTGDDPSLVSMKIYTALDRSIQDGINKVLSGEAHTWADDSVQAGFAITNVNDGTIVAIGAGRNRNAGDWNYATQSRRQPGSTAKPIFDYGPGFEYNDFSTYTLFNDEPWTYTN